MLTVKCNCCGKLNNVNTSGQHRTGSRGPKADDTNTRAVLGSLHAGIGLAQLNNFLSENIPSINSVLYKRREREIDNAVKVVARGSCLSNLNLERKIAQANTKTQDGDDNLPGMAKKRKRPQLPNGAGGCNGCCQKESIVLPAKPTGPVMPVKRQRKL